MADHNEFGQQAEEFVAQKYIKNGYKIRARNWRFHPLELDIVAEKDNELVFVEVKARETDIFGDPLDSITKKKMRFILLAANEYMELNDIEMECRFDIATVLRKNDGLAAKIYVDAFEPYEL